MALKPKPHQTEPTETQSLLDCPEIDNLDYNDENPLTWPTARKAAILGVVSFSVFNDAMGTGLINPGVSQIVSEFHLSSPAVAPFLVSIHVIGLAIGPLVVSPASELWGRCPLMHISNAIFVVSLIMSALSQNITTLLVARVMTGMAGCVPIVLEGGFIADLTTTENRGKIIAIWTLAPLLGYAIGPIVAGELTHRLGWRSAFWLMLLLAGLQAFAAIFALKETYVPAILRQKNSRSEDGSPSGKWGPFKTAVSRPVKLATQSPVVILSALNMSMTYVFFYILVADLPTLFGDHYGFDSAQIGYIYTSPTLGSLVGLIIVGGISDRIFQQRFLERGVSKPQDRLATLLPGNLIVATGILGYGWSVQADMHWMMPLLGISLTMIGISGVFLPLQQYLTDYFGPHVPSAVTVCTVLRSILAAILPSTSPALYNGLGFGWGNTVLACVALAFCPTTYILIRYEENYGASYIPMGS